MAAPANVPMIDTSHTYDADAFVFSADLKQPILKVIERQAFLELPAAGGYKYEPVRPFQADGIVSHRGGYSQVAGHPSSNGSGVTTLATSVIEGLNILEVLTADHVVAQIITEHPDGGSVPSVSFLGTHFDNLRIAGQKIEVEPHLEILGPKPDDDESYFNDGGVFSRIAHQYSNIKRMMGLPKWASDQFNWDSSEAQRQNEINCSLVNGVSESPGKSFGHVIDLPHFGKIFLAELKVIRTPMNPVPSTRANAGPRLETSDTDQYAYRFQLTMIRTELDNSVFGTVICAYADPNGSGHPQPPPPPDERKPRPKV
jgi:hypothetical protein